jgi:hypothetical protein
VPRVLAVTPYPTRALELRREQFEVADARTPSDVGNGVAQSVDGALLELSDLTDVLGVITTLRSSAPQLPIVVLGPPDETWRALEQDGFTVVVAPPVSFEQIAGALRTLIRPAPAPSEGSSEAEQRRTTDVSEPAELPPPERDQPAERIELPGPPRPDWRASAIELVSQLAETPTVAEVCDELCLTLAETCTADAVAVLVRSGDRWLVEGSVGLRPLEHRLNLGEDDWLVQKLRGGPPVLVIPDTDLVRSQLAFTPLASRASLLAVCFGDQELLLLAGRDSAPFARKDVTTVTNLVSDETARLTEALDTRALARELARFL